LWTPYQSKRASASDLNDFWDKYPTACPAAVTGAISGFTVVDIDRDDAYGFIPTVTSNTISGGRHHFCKLSTLQTVSDKDRGIDIRSNGGIVVLPPAFHGTSMYSWDEMFPLTEENLKKLAPVPDDIFKHFSERQQKQKIDISSITAPLTAGTNRHGALLAVVGSVVTRLPKELLASVGWHGVLAWNKEFCDPPKPEDEIRKMFEYCVRKRILKESVTDNYGRRRVY
jgi:hypothetical protein